MKRERPLSTSEPPRPVKIRTTKMPDGQQLHHLESDEEDDSSSQKGATPGGKGEKKADQNVVEVVDLSQL